jgi:integrase
VLRLLVYQLQRVRTRHFTSGHSLIARAREGPEESDMKSTRPHVATPCHPLTGQRFRVRARTERELESYMHRIDSLREGLRLEMVSAEDVDRQLRRLRFGRLTLARAARSYARREDLADNTRRRIESVIAGPLFDLAAEELDALDGPRLAAHFDKLARVLARSSFSAVWRTLRAIVRHAAEKGWTARSPWGTWRPRQRAGQAGRKPRECARTRRELALLLAAARELDARQDAPYRALEAKIATAAHLGLRQGELAGLRWYDVSPDRHIVAVRRQWDGRPLKAGDAAELEGDPELFEALELHAARLGLPPRGRGYNEDAERYARECAGNPLFPAPAGGPYTSGECLSTRDLRMCVRVAHLNDPSAWSPHSLRDTFVTLEAQRHGGDLARIAIRTRHRSIASLVRYLRAFERGTPAPALLPPSTSG